MLITLPASDTQVYMRRALLAGEPAPWFHAAVLSGNQRFAFNVAAGRWILMLFAGKASGSAAEAALQQLAANRDLFDDQHACFFGVTVDAGDANQGRIAQLLPGVRWIVDYDRRVSEAYGAWSESQPEEYTPFWVLLDPMQRVHSQVPLSAGAEMIARLRELAGLNYSLPAPVLVVPGVLPPEICKRMIELYDQHGGQESGFMREIDGVTQVVTDHNYKRRADYTITDEPLLAALKNRVYHVLRPMVQRAFQFEATRVERWIVARYDAAQGGFFRPHRDNTTKGTAHRKFAVTINLDADSHEGGNLRFPEFGPQTYRAPTGGAVVFSCSLLHEALPVTNGKRYAFLPFLYDDEGAKLREQNQPFVAPELRGYRSNVTQ